MDITFISPFPEEHYERAWKWINESGRDNSFDDDGPRTYEEFEQEMKLRSEQEETWGVFCAGLPCGFIGYRRLSLRKGMLHGIFFSPRVHGTAITQRSMGNFIALKFASGVEKIVGAYFQSNLRVGRFLQRLGAKTEGLLIGDTIQNGQPVNAVLFAFFPE